MSLAMWSDSYYHRGMPKRLWTPEEVSALRGFAAKHGAAVFSLAPAKLGRSSASVAGQLQRLGLRRRKERREALRPLTACFAAYLAGLIDGEGTIQINPSKGEGSGYFWVLAVSVASSAPGFLDHLHERCGAPGTVREHKTPRKPAFRWSMYGTAAEWMLEQVTPYLMLKQEHGKIGLAFRRLVRLRKARSISPKVLTERSRLALRLRELNAKTGKSRLRVARLAR